MISVSANQKIFDHAIQVEKPLLESSDLAADATVTLFAGQPVRISAALAVVPVTTDVKVFGLSKVNKNAYVDETAGALGGIYGSGKVTVVNKGIVTLRHNYFQTNSGATATVYTFDEGTLIAVAPMTALYASTVGNISTSAGAAGTTNCKIGYVLVAPTATVKAMQIMLDC